MKGMGYIKMSHILKLRAWDGKKMFFMGLENEGDFIHVIKINGKPHIIKYPCLESCPVELMQYSGVEDKNDMDVYEGDILGCLRGGPVRVEFFVEGGCWIGRRIYKMENFADEVSPMFRYMKILGNIYEHPHLLEFK